MKAKKWIISCLIAVMTITMMFGLAACGQKEHTTHPDENGDSICDIGGEELNTEIAMTDGFYLSEAVDMGAGRGNAYTYVRFHESGIFYYAIMANSTAPGGGVGSYAGYWEIVEEDYTYYNGVTGVEETVSSYIKFTNFDGTPVDIHQTNGDEADGASPVYDDKVPFVNDTLYGVWYTDMAYTHVLEHDVFTVENENGVTVASFVKNVGDADAVTLYHTGKFEDYISDAVTVYDGTWAVNGLTYTLTETGGATATLVVSEDYKTASYTDFKGAEVDLLDINTVIAELVYTFRGDGTVTRSIPDPETGEMHDVPLAAYIIMNFYDDGKMEAFINMPDSGMFNVPQGGGTWVESASGIVLTANGTDYTIDSSMSFEFDNSIVDGGKITMALEAGEVEPQIIAETTNMYFTLSFYDNGTFTAVASMGGMSLELVPATGTWSMTYTTFTINDGTPIAYTVGEGFSFTYHVTTPTGSFDQDLSFAFTADDVAAFVATLPEPTLLAETTNMYFTLSFYNNGTFKAVASMGGMSLELVPATGTWSITENTFTINDDEPVSYTASEGIVFTYHVTTPTGSFDQDLSFTFTAEDVAALLG